jgi:hypothetical protein
MNATRWAVAAVLVAAGVAVVPVSAAMADPVPPLPAPLCKAGYAPTPDQPVPAEGTVCVAVDTDPHGNLHARVKADPLLCVHLQVGNNGEPAGADAVRSLSCHRYSPVTPTPTPTPEPVTAAPAAPVAPAPPVVQDTLPVTH